MNKRTRQIPSAPVICDLNQTFCRLGFNFAGTSYIPNYIRDHAGKFCAKYSHKNVMLVGINPSQKSPDTSAFHKDTKSGKRVRSWFKEGEGWWIEYQNIFPFKMMGNRPPSTQYIKEKLPYITTDFSYYQRMGYKLVACGKTASKALTMAGIEHFEMPHPSGLNRFWNDREASEAKIREMKEWILGTALT